MSSHEFLEWGEARMKAANPPGDYYRAYMIDRSLRAPIDAQEKWRKSPQNLDSPGIDNPGGWSQAPAQKPRMPSRKEQIREKKQPQPPKGSIGEQRYKREAMVKGIAERLAAEHGSSVPNFDISHKTGALGHGRMSMKMNRETRQIVGATLSIGAKGDPAHVKAVTSHEMGHFIHATASKEKLKAHGVSEFSPMAAGGKNWGSAALAKARYADESAAWKFGKTAWKDFSPREKKVAAWVKANAIGTYRHHVTEEDVPGKPNMKIWKWGGKRF